MYMVNYTSDDFKKNLGKSTTVILPIGCVEAHGHHCPLGTDIFAPRLFCKRIDEKMGDKIWIAPEVPYGMSYDLSFYPGTVNIPSKVVSDYMYSVGKALFDNGMKKLVIMNGHGMNIDALKLASERLVKCGMDVLIINWWMDYSKDIVAITGGQGHAGEDETSAMLYYNEHLVQMDKAKRNPKHPRLRVRYQQRGKEIFQDATSGDPTKATKEQGEKIFDAVTARMIETLTILESGDYYTSEEK